MPIPEIRLYRYTLPLRSPVSLRRGETIDTREGLLLELVSSDGEPFRGEAAPLPGFSSESLDEAQNSLKRLVAEFPDTPGPAKWSFDALTDALVDSSPSVDFALKTALAGVSDRDIPVDVSLQICGLLSGSRGEILSDAAGLRERGYAAAKLKVGRRSVDEDAALVGEVSEVLAAELRLDANRAWSFEEASRFAALVEDLGVEYVEEPLSDPGRLGEFSRESGLPVALDESLAEPLLPEDLSFARAFVLKPTLLGYSRSASLARRARSVGASTIISSSYESGVGTLALARFAAAHGDGAAGLDTYRRFAADLLSPTLDLSNPRVELGELLGVRREVDYERLERIA